MSRSRLLGLLTIAVIVGAVACVTVNIYFPAPEVRAAAEEIVEETWGDPSATPAGRDVTPEDESLLPRLLGPTAAHAKEADINVSTAAIRALKASMKARAEQLKPYLRSGTVGIDREGLLAIRSFDAVPLRDQATIRRLIDAENRDRLTLYKEIAKANDFGNDRIGDIKRIFADEWRRAAEPGWSIQKPDGSWEKK
jgi:uncharacterized protein YdbL (DUF1318 family)